MEFSAARRVLSFLSGGTEKKILEYLTGANTPLEAVSEIRLRLHGPSALVVSGKNVSFGPPVSQEEIRDTFKRICGGAVFAHRDDTCRGFVSLEGGIRVGVCGEAKYERGSVVGVAEISSLVFRIPGGACSFAGELYKSWCSLGSGGMLICSAAGEGKTTAIRALARLIGSGMLARRVVVADERCEFDPSYYGGSHVDILRGYKRSLGVDIAIRTLSAEVLIVDEISSCEDSLAMLSAIGAGVTVIATSHGRSFRDVMKRGYVRELVEAGLFESVCVISRSAGRFSFSLDRIQECKS